MSTFIIWLRKYNGWFGAAGGLCMAAGLYLGRLEQRVSELEEEQEYSHGDVRTFMERTAR